MHFYFYFQRTSYLIHIFLVVGPIHCQTHDEDFDDSSLDLHRNERQEQIVNENDEEFGSRSVDEDDLNEEMTDENESMDERSVDAEDEIDKRSENSDLNDEVLTNTDRVAEGMLTLFLNVV